MITIIGLPLAWANVKLIPIALWPFGREIVPADEVAAVYAGTRHEGALMPPVDLPAERSQS